MSLDLSTINFSVNTKPLEAAAAAIGELVTNVGKLDKAARDAAQTEVVLAKAAKLNADANLQNAKAQDTRLKSTITADKADQQATAAIEKKTKATEKVNEVVNKNVGVLQRQKDILEFQTQGFSKGQSSILAYGKAAGLAADDIGELGKVLETQRKLMGVDPFDKSLSGIKSLQNQYTELKESIRQYATDSNLTAKQTRELARDKERLIEKMKVEGASFSEIRHAVRAHNTEYVNLATSYNKMTSAEDAVIKSRKEAVNATNYLTQADQKMSAALNTSNAALDKAGTDSLVKYETALRKSGVSQDVATQKLATYKAQLAQVAAVEEKRREQHLTRALTPQISDVAVSLWSGQSPLTVLLQQGAQINDMFQLSGVAAADFGKTVKEAFSSMIPSIRTVVKGVGGLVVDGFMAAGGAVLGFAGRVTGMTGAVDAASKKLMDMGWTTAAAGAEALGASLTGTFASGVAVAVAVLISLGIAFKNAIKEGGELTRSLELTGASLALTKSSALELAQSLASSERPVANVVNVINELAKAGKFSSEDIALVTNAAIDLERYGKVSIAETAKELSKLREDPVKALLEVAEKTGYVNLETIATIKSLREQGKMAEAAELAMKAWATSSTSAATSIKNQMSPLEQVWDGILSKINQVIGKLQDVARGSGTAEQIADKEAQLASVRGGFFTSTFGLSPKGAKDVDRLTEEIYMLKLQLQAETDITKERAKRSSAASQLKAEAEATKEYTTALEKQASKELTLSAFVKKAVEERTKVVAAALGKNVEDVKLSAEAVSNITSGAELQWQEMQKKTKSSSSENYFATIMREATAASIKADDATKSLTASQVKLLEAVNDPRFLKLSKVQQETYLSTMAANVATEQQTALTGKLAEAEEHRLKLLGKSEGIGKQYYSDMQKLEEFAKVAGWSRGEVEELTRAVFKATPAWKAYEKALEDVNSASRKFNEDSIASQAATLKENESLDYRLSLLGKTTEEQRALSIEYNRANKIADVRIKLAKQLRDIEEKIEKAKKDGLPESDYQSLIDAQVQARKDAAEQEKVINREVAVAYKEDLQKEFDAIKNGISDSIVTALFEGGKSGSKKLRDLVVAELKKPVTMVVNAVVNTVLGNTIGSLMGGTGAGGGNSVMGGIQTASNLNSLYGAGAQAIWGGTAGASAASLGYANIVGMAGGDAIGALATANGMWAGVATGAQAAAQSAIAANAAMAAGEGVALAAGTNAAAAGAGAAGGAGGASSALAAIPGWGWALAGVAALAALWDDNSGTPHMGAGAIYKDGRLREGKDLYGSGAFSMGHRDEYNANAQAGITSIAQGLGIVLDNVAVSFGQKAGYEIATAFADDSSEDGAWGSLRISKEGKDLLNWRDTQTSRWAPKEFGDGEEGYKQYLAAVAKDTRQVLLDMDIPGWAKTILKDIGENPSMEALSGAIQLLAQVETVFKSFGQYMPQFANLADSAKETLIKASGGVQALTGNMSSFVNAFYTDAEKLAINSNNLSEALSKLGFEMPKTREEFKALVQSQIELGDSGAESLAALLSLSGAMDAVLPAFNDGTDAVSGLSEVMKGLKEETANLEIELLRAKGDTAGADARQRALDTQGFTEAEVAAYDYNRTLREQIEALKRLTQLQQQSTSLEIELLRAKGQTPEADVRQRELDTSGFSQAEIVAYDYNQSLREQIRVLQQLNELQKQSTSLEIELLRARGLTAEADVRQRELDTSGFSQAEIAAYDYNQSLREQIGVLQQLNELQKQSTNLEIELLRARGLTAEADARQREIEISGMTAAQVALYDYNRALRGQIDSIRAAASAMDGLSNTRFDLENQLLTAQGNTTEVDRRTRERDLAGLTEGLTAEQAAAVKQAYDYNIALREQIRVQEEANRAAQQAADAASQAAQQAADAAKSVRDAWQSITDSIMEEVKRIRNIVRGEDSQSLAYYQQQFAVKTSAARSGDQEASKLLPELSKTLLDLAELNATSYFELQLYRTQTAASLEETARILSGAYGTTLPSFDVGTNYVTKDMTARIHQGEAILPKAFNPWAGGSLPSNAGDSERMSNLEDKLVTLANTVTTIAISTNKINRLLERVSRDGDALQVSVVS